MLNLALTLSTMEFLFSPSNLAARLICVPWAMAALLGYSPQPAENTSPARSVITQGTNQVAGAKPEPVVPGNPAAAETQGGSAAPIGKLTAHPPLHRSSHGFTTGRGKGSQTMFTKSPALKPVPENLAGPDERAAGYRVVYSVEIPNATGQHLTIHVEANPGAPAVTEFHLKIGSPVTVQAIITKPTSGDPQASIFIPSGPTTSVKIIHATATNRGGGVDLEFDVPFARKAKKGESVTFTVPIEGVGKPRIKAHVPGIW